MRALSNFQGLWPRQGALTPTGPRVQPVKRSAGHKTAFRNSVLCPEKKILKFFKKFQNKNLICLTENMSSFICLSISENEYFPGGYRERAIPVPIPNTEVKPLIADGTAWVAMWESRTPPG